MPSILHSNSDLVVINDTFVYTNVIYNMNINQSTYKKFNTPRCRLKIALALGLTEQSIINAIKFKRDVLTKKAALDIIKSETGLNEDEIFEQLKTH
jgi:hypothetical protein